jgi:NAD(P)-dependent dehydrogenase (short-subunit alcohol dehydrogenase family)
MTGELRGRAAIITGGNQGLGLAIARAYVEAGAHVFLCARDERKLRHVLDELGGLSEGDQQVLGETADVSKESDVRRVVDHALSAFEELHVLVNNAGVYGPLGRLEDVPWLDWVRAMEVNLHGSALMCRAVLPHFRARRYGKIIQLSGGGATSPLPRITAYAASKAAVVRLAESLAEDTRNDNIDVNAIAPGALNTRLLDEVLAAGPEVVGPGFHARSEQQKHEGGAPLEHGSRLAVFLASPRSDGITGKLLSAVWDPWETLPEHLDDLGSDVYTLRRIVPKDRGLSWGND